MFNNLKSVIFSCALLFATASFSQTYFTDKTITGQAKVAYELGLTKIKSGDKDGALVDFTQSAKFSPNFIDAHIQMGAVLRQLNQWEKAEAAFEKALALDANYDSRVLYGLAMIEQKISKYGEAAQHFEAYAASSSADPAMATKAKEAAVKAKEADMKATADASKANLSLNSKSVAMVKPLNLGTNINDANSSQYFPTLTADGEMLVFTRVIGYTNEDFYFSKKVNGVWEVAKPMTDLNTTQNEGAQYISADGKTLMFDASDRKDGLGGYDVYMSNFKNGKWEPAQNLTDINSKYYDGEPAISADKRTIYFSSNRPDKEAVGGADIWYSTFENGKWQTPKNLGKQVNSTGNEYAPFIHPDGVTLYFASDGLDGLGGMDIFYTRRNSNGEWSKPENLGAPINTPQEERSLSVSLDGKMAFFSRTRETETSKRDLFYFNIPQKAQPKLVTYIKAVVHDATSKLPLSTELSFMDAQTRANIQTGTTDNSGVFLLTLPLGKNYALTVSKKGYMFYSQTFDLASASANPDKPYLLNIDLIPLKTTTPSEGGSNEAKVGFTLKNINFATAQTEPLSESFIELDNLVQLLNVNPSLEIAIHGYTDNQGSEASNKALSEKRAAAVKNYIISKGIEAKRLKSKGFGESNPIDSNETDEGKARNRRTEFVVLKYE